MTTFHFDIQAVGCQLNEAKVGNIQSQKRLSSVAGPEQNKQTAI